MSDVLARHLRSPPDKRGTDCVTQPAKIIVASPAMLIVVKQPGEALVSTGVITLSPHPDFLDIHYKSVPLVLQPGELDGWMDKNLPHEDFKPLFNLTDYRQSLEAVPVNEPAFEPIGDPVPLIPGAKTGSD